MRLEKIKLAGFKSFVDPTTIPTPGNLVGIVGPNGCGKSNVIDAVRWVMGESSAKHLRGESMADVIFNGSSTRKPVGMASVELVFDNSEGKAPGEFSKYPQISIKRQVARDGQSTYILNGSRCRRKDITDLFLGTGLGSRSYAIIEQGTISRLIEAKPHELRELIEEAAGISKYKERRHETELRMGHTIENLDRLIDLREEVGKQLETLRRQAKKAEKYSALKQDERNAREQLLGARWKKYDNQLQAHKQSLNELEKQFRLLTETGQEIKENLENTRSEHESIVQNFSEEQGKFYSLSSEISRVSQSLKHALETQQNLEAEEARVINEKHNTEADLESDRLQLELLGSEKNELKQILVQFEIERSELQAKRDNVLEDLHAIRIVEKRTSEELRSLKHRGELQEAEARQVEQASNEIAQRSERLEEELNELAKTDEPDFLLEMMQEEATLIEQQSDLLLELAQNNATIQDNREQLISLRVQADKQGSDLHSTLGTMRSLETLQQHALGQDNSNLANWVARNGLEVTDNIAKHLVVQPGWETAVEFALGDRIRSLCVENLKDFLAEVEAIKGEAVALFETVNRSEEKVVPENHLTSKVESPWDLTSLIGNIYCSANLMEAERLRNKLSDQESIITPNGLWIGSNWLISFRTEQGNEGVIQRESKIRELTDIRDCLLQLIEETNTQQSHLDLIVKSSEASRERLQSDERALTERLGLVRSEIAAIKGRNEQIRKRITQIKSDQEDLAQRLGEFCHHRDEIKDNLLEVAEGMAHLQDQLQSTREKESDLALRLSDLDYLLKSRNEEIAKLHSRLESIISSEALTAKHMERTKALYDQSLQKLNSIKQRFSQTHIPDEDNQTLLDDLTSRKLETEIRLEKLRTRDDSLKNDIRVATENTMRNDRDLDAIKTQLEQIRVELTANEVRKQSLIEQFTELEIDQDSIGDNLPTEIDESACQRLLLKLTEEIARLGAVNLMALEECGTQEERLNFLDQQTKDLNDSLATLKEAIERIDKECRSRFKETFDSINAGLQRMFPKLFGGGQAHLELTDNQILEAGVTVMARPPGKRNSSIHLLSGGEKALTAAALVFAIFELNPAPFCLLDEVDAPLDDANVGRFSQLVKEMSERVQFLFISHNKATMEIAEHLAGVTMKEPGVSRIVTVDIDAAVELSAI